MLRRYSTLGTFTLVLAVTAVASTSCGPTSTTCDDGIGCVASSGAGNAGASSGSGNTAGKSGTPQGGSSGAGGEEATAGSAATGASGQAGAGGGGNECDTSKSPAEEGCLVSDEHAVFVSAAGDDASAGSQASPLATLTKAVELAEGKLILVCNASYDEHVVVTSGSRIYGGFKCENWSRETGKPLFKPSTSGPALTVDTVSDEVLLEDVVFEVGDATAAGETALTALVNASPQVTLRGVELTAGKGKAGANGALAGFTFPGKESLKGNAESPAGAGGADKKCPCQGTLMSIGGLGGAAIVDGQSGTKGLPDHGVSSGVGGDHTKTCSSGGSGGDGANAPPAGPASGASTLGSATATGWQSSSGTDGATGKPGQGGGGGASRNASGHGGGGGCGGCGGNGGSGGQGGGASIALLALGSAVSLEGCALTTADAGDGGKGEAGQAGQPEAGTGGNVSDVADSCAGGSGGFGGDGGAGGGGAGGISVGVVWKGARAPVVGSDTTVTTGQAGAKGIGGVAGTNDGLAGVAQKVLALN